MAQCIIEHPPIHGSSIDSDSFLYLAEMWAREESDRALHPELEQIGHRCACTALAVRPGHVDGGKGQLWVAEEGECMSNTIETWEVSLGSMRIEPRTRRHLVASLASVQEPIHHGLDLIIAHQPGLRFRHVEEM